MADDDLAKRNCRPDVAFHNPNIRRCGKPLPCPPKNPNMRPKPCCPRPCNEPSCSSSSSSSSDCSSSSSSSSECYSVSSSSEHCGCVEPSSVSCHDHHHHHHDHHHHDHHHGVGPVQLDVNGGWYKFHFGPAGSTVGKTYDFVTTGPAVLRITDLDCSGDALSVYDNGFLILQTPLIGGDNCHHAHELVSPHRAYGSDHYSHGRVNLAPGAHSIKIVVARAPEGRGVGALRVDSVMAQCPRELNGLKVVNTPVPHHKAAGVCKALGMKLADIDIYNFLDATTLAFECAGAFSASWIKSYWKDDYNGAHLALYTGNSAPGGSINVPGSCEEHLPVICQAIKPEEECGCESSSSSSWSSCSYANHDCVCCECSESSDSCSSSN